jgi:hypothetical protein
MKNLSKLEVFKLDKVQMNVITGGISREEYCKDLQYLANTHNEQSWSEKEWDNWADAYSKHCI